MALVGDERGQAIQIGAVLLFAVLIVSFSTYQAFIVPNQNRQVEFNHNQQVQRDMIEVRNTLLETYTGGNDGYAELTLGTNYPARLVSTNPGPPTGSLRTTDSSAVRIEQQSGADETTNVCPNNGTVETRSLEYEPNYNVYQGAGTLRYENSVVYHDFGSEIVPLTGQTLIRGDTVQVIPITREFNAGGTRTESVEPRAGLLDTTEMTDIRVELPTELNESQWESLLAGEVDPENVTVTGWPDDPTLELTLGGSWTVSCGPVGIGEVPPSGERGGGVGGINPAEPGDIRLEDESRSGDTMTLEFNNTAGTNNITEARINFYEAQSNPPNSADIAAVGEPTSATLDVGGDFEPLAPEITLEGDGTVTQVELAFNGGSGVNPNDWFVVTIELETGETGIYFVSAR
jgi:hypothetical protein